MNDRSNGVAIEGPVLPAYHVWITRRVAYNAGRR